MNYEEASFKYLEENARFIPVTAGGEESSLYVCRYNGKLLSHEDTGELRLMIEKEMRAVHEDDETRKVVQRLGRLQKELYRCLIEHGSWYEGCGWIWDNFSTTTRILESLVKRGLAYRIDREGGLFLDRGGSQYYPIVNNYLAEWFGPGGSRGEWDRYIARAKERQAQLLKL